MQCVRFATIGTSLIQDQFMAAIADVECASVTVCYSRDLERARAYAERWGVPRAVCTLEELAASDDVDAVYVASPNALHAGQAKLLAAAGKHVLVEKSFASNRAEAQEVFDTAEKSGVVAMEAMRNLHVPSFDVIRNTIPELGLVRKATFRFSKVTSRIARLRAGERLNIFDPRMSAGALMDMGVYCVEPAVALFGVPDRVSAMGVTVGVPGCAEDDPFGTIDLAGEVLLGYADKVVSLSYGKLSDDMLPSQIEGEGATLVWDQTSCPVNLRVYDHEDKGMVFRMGGEQSRPIEVSVPDRDMACEILDFCSAVGGNREQVAWLRDVTLGSLAVMDEVRAQLGVRFPADGE